MNQMNGWTGGGTGGWMGGGTGGWMLVIGVLVVAPLIAIFMKMGKNELK